MKVGERICFLGRVLLVVRSNAPASLSGELVEVAYWDERGRLSYEIFTGHHLEALKIEVAR